MSYPSNLRYTKEHEWISLDGNVATIGITEYAQRELGDIVFVEVDTIGKNLEAGAVFGTVEAVKTIMPVASVASTPEEQAKEYRSKADKLAKEAAQFRRLAEDLVPTKKPVK